MDTKEPLSEFGQTDLQGVDQQYYKWELGRIMKSKGEKEFSIAPCTIYIFGFFNCDKGRFKDYKMVDMDLVLPILFKDLALSY